MELAGLEPATSWVRFTSNPSPPLVILRHWFTDAGLATPCFATVCGPPSPEFDQRLTTGWRSPRLHLHLRFAVSLRFRSRARVVISGTSDSPNWASFEPSGT